MRFVSARGVISEELAVSAYYRTFQLIKGYVAVPQKLDLSDPEYGPAARLQGIYHTDFFDVRRTCWVMPLCSRL